jgi:hypothetical protein
MGQRILRWLSSGFMLHTVCWKFTKVSEVLAASIIQAISEWVLTLFWLWRQQAALKTSVHFYHTTWSLNSADSHLHTHCCKNLKSHLKNMSLVVRNGNTWKPFQYLWQIQIFWILLKYTYEVVMTTVPCWRQQLIVVHLPQVQMLSQYGPLHSTL